MRNRLPSGHGWAYLGVALGLTASIAGNVANTVLTVSRVPLELRVPFAVIWPIFLGIGIEVLTRIDWKAGWKHWGARALLIGPMSLVSGFMSYLHLHHLMILSGEPGLAQTVGPLAVDGTLFGCTVALLVTRAKARTTDAAPTQTLAQRVATLKAGVTDTLEVLVAPKAARNLDLTPAPAITEAVAQVQDAMGRDLTKDLDLTPVLTQDQDPTDLPATAQAFLDAVQANRRTRTSVDYAKVARLVLELDRDQDVADRAGLTGTKTAQRTRRAVRLLGTTDDVAAIASTVKLPLTAVQTIAQELTR